MGGVDRKQHLLLEAEVESLLGRPMLEEGACRVSCVLLIGVPQPPGED